MELGRKKCKSNSQSEEDGLILDIWDQYENQLRTCKRNSDVYEQMALATNNKFTAKELHLKIRNFRERYRAERVKTDASNNYFSEWVHYQRVHQILESNRRSASKIKVDPHADPLAEESTKSTLLVPFSPVHSPLAILSEHSPDSTKWKLKRKRKDWTHKDNLLILGLWEKYRLALGKTKHNAHIYAEIAKEIQKFNAHEVHTKIRNFVQKYRTEKKLIESGGNKEWIYYDRVDEIMTNPQKSIKHDEEYFQNETTLEYDQKTSPAPSTSSTHSQSLTSSKKKISRRKRNHWTTHDNLLILHIWEKYEPELRSTPRNGHIYEKISEETKGKFDNREVFNKIRNLTQRYRKERKEIEALQEGSFSEWTFYDRVHKIIGDRPCSDSQVQCQYSDNNEQDSYMDMFPLADESQSNSLEHCLPNKVTFSPFQEGLPDTSPKSSCSEASETLPTFLGDDERKNEAIQAEILDNIRKQTEMMEKLVEQSENLNNNFQKFVETQTAVNRNLLQVLQKIADK